MSDASKNRPARFSPRERLEDKLMRLGFTGVKLGCSMMVLGITLPILALILFFIFAAIWSWIFPTKNDSDEAPPAAISSNHAGGALMAEAESQSQMTGAEYKAEIRSLFNDLMAFRDNERFFQHGFGVLGYFDWKQRMDKLRKASFLKGTDTTALSSLVELGQGYEKTRGRDDESTLILSSMVRESLGIP